jgi:cyclic beta-1,2-glucan synthetase
MASEARLSGYIAVARGECGEQALGAPKPGPGQKVGYRGMASRTGTMFEYLMPELSCPA